MTDASSTIRRTIYIDPPSQHFLKDRLFEPGMTKFTGDNLMAPYEHMRAHLNERGIGIRTIDYLPKEVDLTQEKIYVSLGIIENYVKVSRRPDVTMSGLFAMECPINEPTLYREFPKASKYFRSIYSWSSADALVPFTGERVKTHLFRWPQSFDRVHEGLWQRGNRKFLVMMNSNKLPRLDYCELYSERLRALAYFAGENVIDLYGGGWNRASNRVGKSWMPHRAKSLMLDAVGQWQRFRPDSMLKAARSVYRGRAPSKSSTLSQYTFALCFENMVLEGWITEKLFDCFFVGTVPVYLGAPEIDDLVPRSCFIDMRQFRGYEELLRFLVSRTPNQIASYKRSARDFLESSGFDPFRKSTFARLFENLVEQHTLNARNQANEHD